MATTVTWLGTSRLDSTQSTQLVRGSIALTGSYTTGGDTLNLGGSTSPVQSAQLPLNITFTEIATTPSGAAFGFVPGTTLANGKLFINTAFETQLAAGAYDSTLLATSIYFVATFPLGM